MAIDAGITAAALIAQVSILAIMCVGSFLIALDHREALVAGFILLALALLTVVPLMLTSGYASMWTPFFGGSTEIGIQRSASIVLMFILDILALSVLVWKTSGSLNSPFQAIYFLLPALAIFLREPVARLLLYFGFVTASFTLLTFLVAQHSWYNPSARIHRLAYWLMAVACFALAMFIGYVTRPIS
jgi:hypothetical protein